MWRSRAVDQAGASTQEEGSSHTHSAVVERRQEVVSSHTHSAVVERRQEGER